MDDAVYFILALFIMPWVWGAAWKLASEKGRSRVGWTIATVLIPLALPLLVYLSPRRDEARVRGRRSYDDTNDGEPRS